MAMGPLPQRAAVGHCPGRLQPAWYAWESFPHDHARRRAYRWGENGLAGFSDKRQQICLSLGLWNGRDPILKERLFGKETAENILYSVSRMPSSTRCSIAGSGRLQAARGQVPRDADGTAGGGAAQ